MKWLAVISLAVAILAAVAGGGIYAASDETCTTTYELDGVASTEGNATDETTTCTREWPWE